jgi:biotin transport system substrate-specific component
MSASINPGEQQLRSYLLAGLFAALTAIGAFIKIPLLYVPITLQTFFVILSGSVLGARFGALSQVLYLIVGLLGVPIFSFGGGPGYLFQPTFGYLLGYPIGAFVVGYLVWGKHKNGKSCPQSFLYLCFSNGLGVLIIFIFGVTFLYFNLKMVVGKPISFGTAIWSGFIIFIPGDILKILLSSWVTRKLNRILNI